MDLIKLRDELENNGFKYSSPWDGTILVFTKDHLTLICSDDMIGFKSTKTPWTYIFTPSRYPQVKLDHFTNTPEGDLAFDIISKLCQE